jgi:antibiotic biosynthesis monooxygenase (ABM) superfamily enzyme
MNILIQVRHYTTPRGRRAFPGIMRLHRRLAAAHPGFIGLRRLAPVAPKRPGVIDVVIEFASMRQIMRWRRSPGHQRMAEAYARCWSRPPEVQFFEIKPF